MSEMTNDTKEEISILAFVEDGKDMTSPASLRWRRNDGLKNNRLYGDQEVLGHETS